MTFPLYPIIRERKIFRDRDDLLSFEEACGFESDMSNCFDRKDFAKAEEVLMAADILFDETMKEKSLLNHALSLPSFLRR